MGVRVDGKERQVLLYADTEQRAVTIRNIFDGRRPETEVLQEASDVEKKDSFRRAGEERGGQGPRKEQALGAYGCDVSILTTKIVKGDC